MNLIAACVFGSVVCLAMYLKGKRSSVGPAALRSVITSGGESAAVLSAASFPLEESTPGIRIPFLRKLEAEARKAGVNVTGRSFLLVAVLASGAVYTLVAGITGNLGLALCGSVAGLLAPRYWLAAQKRKRTTVINSQLETALATMASALRGGSSLAQAISQAARDTPDPLGTELRRVEKGIQLGMSPADALAVVLRDRVDSPDVDLMVIATQILARTGGNLVEVYGRLAETVRERKAFRQAVRASTAQARMSGMMVSFMPIAMTVFVRLLNPHYFDPMFATLGGKLLFLGAFGLIAFGWTIIQRMLDVGVD